MLPISKMVENENMTFKQLYEKIIESNTELKNLIDTSEIRLLLQKESLKNILRNLEEENIDLKRKVESLERNNRKNNLLIFCLEEPPQEISV